MNCYECARSGEERPAVGLCRHCLVGLCLDHLRDALRPFPTGMQFGCWHVARNPSLDRRRAPLLRSAAAGRRASRPSMTALGDEARLNRRNG